MTKYAQLIITLGIILWVLFAFLWSNTYNILYWLMPTSTAIYIAGIILWMVKRSRKLEEERKLPVKPPEPVDMSSLAIVERIITPSMNTFVYVYPAFFVIIFLIMSMVMNFGFYTIHLEREEWQLVTLKLDSANQLDDTFGKDRLYTYPKWKLNGDSIRYTTIHTKGSLAVGSFSFISSNSKIDSLTIEK